MQLFHNPKCSKSRAALALLEARAQTFEIREYLQNPPTVDELKHLLQKLNLTAKELLRSKESILTDLDLDLENEEQLIAAMAEYPQLIERPILVSGDKAVIGRPPENILKIL